MPRESISPYFIFSPEYPGGNPPLAGFYLLPTAARVSVPEVLVPAQDEFAPIFRVIMPNLVDCVSLWAATIIPVALPGALSTQIRVSPVLGGISNSYAPIAKGIIALQNDGFCQQVSGVIFRQVSVWARIEGGGESTRVQFGCVIRRSGCCQKNQFA